jgi:uncharacterized protein with HEPN domain
MSDASPRQREWRFYVDDMVAFANTVVSYTAGLDQTSFVGDRRTYDAALHNLELIGEAAFHLPQEIREQNPGIPWRLVIATRNRLIHGYLGIDDDTLWTIIRDDVPQRLAELQKPQRKLARSAG